MSRFWSHPAFWGIVATSAIVLFGIWIGTQELCIDSGECRSKYSAFLEARPNEVGDTLAGFAGALAFVWIIVTVWLQSQELAEQREELRLTRLEMKEQREATQDMARSMAAQAKVFEDEARQRDETRAKELLDELIKTVCKYVSEQESPRWQFLNENKDGSKTSGQKSLSYFFGEGVSYEKQLELWTDHCIRTVQALETDHNKQEITKYPVDETYILGLLGLLTRISNVRIRLSEAQQTRFDALSIEGAISALNLVLNGKFWDTKQ